MKFNFPPSECECIYKEGQMIVTIIGSLNNKEEMIKCKKYWEQFGHIVNCPCDKGRGDLPLINKCSSWINAIERANLVVAIPKGVKTTEHSTSTFVYEFGESTTYEIAIATRFNKPVIIW